MSNTAPRTIEANDGSRHAVLPGDQFYWAVIDQIDQPAAGLGVPARHRDAIRFAFEDLLPIPIEEVACAFAPVGDWFIACGLPREGLSNLINPRTRTLVPATIPPWVLEQAGLPGAPPSLARRLNLLTDEHEPPVVRRARRRQVLQIAALAALLVSLFVAGVQRRIEVLKGGEVFAEERIRAAYARVLPPSSSAQPPAVRLASELRSLERLTVRPSALGHPEAANFDAALSLSRLLARVPEMHLATDSLDILPGRATFVAVVSDPDEAQRLAASFDGRASGDHRWRLRQPQVASERGPDGSPAVRVTLTLEPAIPVHASAPEVEP